MRRRARAFGARHYLPPIGKSVPPLTRKGCAASRPNQWPFESNSESLSRVRYPQRKINFAYTYALARVERTADDIADVAREVWCRENFAQGCFRMRTAYWLECAPGAERGGKP